MFRGLEEVIEDWEMRSDEMWREIRSLLPACCERMLARDGGSRRKRSLCKRCHLGTH